MTYAVHPWLAGDLHHYSRYASTDCDVQLITSGGGGAFLHPTHQLQRHVGLQLPIPSKAGPAGVKPTETVPAQSLPAGVKPTETAPPVAEQAPSPGTAVSLHADMVIAKEASLVPGGAANQTYYPESLYPTRLKSRFLSAANLALPFRNRRLAVMIGVVYMVYAWAYFIAVADPVQTIKKVQQLDGEALCVSLELKGLGADKKSLCRSILAESVENEVNGLERRHTEKGLAKLETYLEAQGQLFPEEKAALTEYRKSKANEFALKDVNFPVKPEVVSWLEFTKSFGTRFVNEAKKAGAMPSGFSGMEDPLRTP